MIDCVEQPQAEPAVMTLQEAMGVVHCGSDNQLDFGCLSMALEASRELYILCSVPILGQRVCLAVGRETSMIECLLVMMLEIHPREKSTSRHLSDLGSSFQMASEFVHLTEDFAAPLGNVEVELVQFQLKMTENCPRLQNEPVNSYLMNFVVTPEAIAKVRRILKLVEVDTHRRHHHHPVAHMDSACFVGSASRQNRLFQPQGYYQTEQWLQAPYVGYPHQRTTFSWYLHLKIE